MERPPQRCAVVLHVTAARLPPAVPATMHHSRQAQRRSLRKAAATPGHGMDCEPPAPRGAAETATPHAPTTHWAQRVRIAVILQRICTTSQETRPRRPVATLASGLNCERPWHLSLATPHRSGQRDLDTQALQICGRTSGYPKLLMKSRYRGRDAEPRPEHPDLNTQVSATRPRCTDLGPHIGVPRSLHRERGTKPRSGYPALGVQAPLYRSKRPHPQISAPTSGYRAKIWSLNLGTRVSVPRPRCTDEGRHTWVSRSRYCDRGTEVGVPSQDLDT